MVKVIFFDIDGTLLSHRTKNVPQSSKQVIDDLRKKGIRVVAATGRHILEIEKLAVKDIPFDAYILLNGQLCLDQDKQVLFSNPICNKEKALKIFNEKQFPLQIVEENRLYINYVNDYVIQAQNALSTPVPEIGEYTGNEIYMLCAFLNEEQMMSVDFSDCTITRWNDYGVDIIAKSKGKVSGIEKYLSINNIAKEDTMAFGDGENDIEMLEYVQIGVAMGNACEQLKKVADYITTDIHDDGVMKALRKFDIL